MGPIGYGNAIPNYAMHDNRQQPNRAAVVAAAHSVQAHRVYIGNLPYAVGWRELKDFMREAGEVCFAEVLMGPDGRSKGCGVAEYITQEAAQKAIAELSDRMLLDRAVFVREDRETQPRYGHQPVYRPGPFNFHTSYNASNGFGRGQGSGRQLFVSGLALTVTWRTLKDTFRQAGNVLRADVIAGKGTGTVLMATEAESEEAIARFNGSQIEGSQILVREDRFAHNGHPFQGSSFISGAGGHHLTPLTPVDPSNQQPSTQVFVNNLPYTIDSSTLLSLCPIGAVNAEVMTFGGKSRGMGVIEFSSLETAHEALDTLHGQVIGGRPLTVKYNERWYNFSDRAVGSMIL